MKDRYNREIEYLRISVTDLCNLRCLYCMPEKGICKGKHEEQLRYHEYVAITQSFVRLGIKKVRITGGEPLIKKGIIDLLKMIGRIDGIEDFAITTNGILLKKYVEQIHNAGVRRINVSLDTFNREKYTVITRGGLLDDVLEGIDAALEVGLTVKLNAVLLKGINDDEISSFIEFSEKKNVDVRFIELMPIGESIDMYEDRFLSLDHILQSAPALKEVTDDGSSSVAQYYRRPGQMGRIGLIRPMSCSFCSSCNRVRLTSQGKVKLCLHSEEEHDLKPLLHNGSSLQEELKQIIMEKPKEHRLIDGKHVTKKMAEIGG